MVKEENEGIFLPKWYLILNTNYYQYNQKLPTFLMLLLFTFFYSIYGLYLFAVENDIISVLIGGIFIVILLGIFYLYWHYKIKPHKLSNVDIFAYLLYRTGLDLTKTCLDKKIGNNLSRDIILLKKKIKRNIKESKGQQPTINALKKLRYSIKYILSVEDKTKSEVAKKLLTIGEITYKYQTIESNAISIFAGAIELVAVKTSYREIFKNFQQYFTEHFTFLCIIIIGVSAIVAYVLPSYNVEFFMAIFASVLGAWLFKTFT